MNLKAKIISIGIVVLLLRTVASQAAVLQVDKLRNDKEVVSISLSKSQLKSLAKNPLPKEEIEFYKNALYDSFKTFSQGENLKCELKALSLFEEKIQGRKISLERIYQELRFQNHIDDILYDLLLVINEDYQKLKTIKFTTLPRKPEAERLAIWDMNKLFQNLSSWPDENTVCAFQEYIQLKEKITVPGKKPDLKLLGSLNAHAYHQKFIDLETYHKLSFLTNGSRLNDRKLWLQDYLKVIMLAKNQLVPKKQSYVTTDLSQEKNFAARKLKRFSKLTQRKLLYQKYDETQILLLAQVLKKASQRMGVDPDTKTSLPFITQEFTVLNDDGEEEYVSEKITLDPQSQYNLARRLLRKDMTDLQMMDSFRKTKVTFSDVVMAGLETGYLSHDDISVVIEYDDLWNPHKTRFERIRSFIFNVTGYGTFFIPPPWNITTSIALGVVENVVDNFFSTGEDNDNPATFIE